MIMRGVLTLCNTGAGEYLFDFAVVIFGVRLTRHVCPPHTHFVVRGHHHSNGDATEQFILLTLCMRVSCPTSRCSRLACVPTISPLIPRTDSLGGLAYRWRLVTTVDFIYLLPSFTSF